MVRRHIVPIRVVGLVILVALFLVQWNGWWYDPTKVPQPRLFFLLDKTFMTPIRLIQFLSLVAVFSIAFPYIDKVVPRLVAFFCLLGRNSLEGSASAPCSAWPRRSPVSCTAAISGSTFLW